MLQERGRHHRDVAKAGPRHHQQRAVLAPFVKPLAALPVERQVPFVE